RDDLDFRTAEVDAQAHEPATAYFTASSSTSNISVAFGGMTPPAPRAPYPSAGGMIKVRLPPTFMLATPSSQPLMTWPSPIGNSNGSCRSTELSNFLPFSPLT